MIKTLSPNFRLILSDKKLLVQLVSTSILFSLPIIYLLYFNFHSYRESKLLNAHEINGTQLTMSILNEYSRLINSNSGKISDEFKNEISPLVKYQNIFNLSDADFRELEIINRQINLDSNDKISETYLIPMLRFVANKSGLILDPTINTYYLMDTLLLRSPKIYQAIIGHEKDSLENKSAKEVKFHLAEMKYSFLQMSDQFRQTNPQFIELDKCISKIDLAIDEKVVITKSTNALQIINSLLRCNQINANLLKNLLEERDNNLTEKYYLTFLLTFLIWLGGNVLGLITYLAILRQKLESSLQLVNQEKKMLEAEKLTTLGELASSILHEIKNPLALIDFESMTLARNIQRRELSNDYIIEKLSRIQQMSKRIFKISDMITAYTRNSQSDTYEEIDSQKIIEDSIYLTNLKSSQKGVVIENSTSSIRFNCRPYQIEQVLVNLINNSIDAIDKLEKKWIKVENEIFVADQTEYLRIIVTDSGNGIDKKVQDKMFSSFFTTKEAGKGTGLGLSVSLKIIESHNGKFYLDANSVNTKFVLEIPLHLKIS